MQVGFVTTYFSEYYKGPIYHQLDVLRRSCNVVTFASNEKSYQYYSGRQKLSSKTVQVAPSWKLKRFDIKWKARGFVYPRNLREKLAEENLDIIHSNEYYQPISWHSFDYALNKKIPFVFTQRRPEVEFSYNIPFKIFDLFGSSVIHGSSAIVSLTTKGKQLLLQRFPKLSPSKITVIPNGVDMRPFLKGDAEKFRRKFNITADKVVMSIGRMYKMKRIDLLIKIFSIISKQVLNSQLVIVGPGEPKQLNVINSLIKSLNLEDKVILTGSIPNEKIADAFAAADVFSLTSEKEPFGYVLLEAGSSSKPSIAFDVGGISDIIQNGKNGFLVEFDDLTGYADKIVELLEDSRKARVMGSEARKIVKSKFTVEKTVGQLSKLYRKL